MDEPDLYAREMGSLALAAECCGSAVRLLMCAMRAVREGGDERPGPAVGAALAALAQASDAQEHVSEFLKMCGEW